MSIKIKRESTGPTRRVLIGAEPIFEGGWFHKGKRARSWTVEDELVAIALLGDVTVDLSDTRSTPTEILVKAYALGRDVDVIVAPGTHVEISGRAHNDNLSNEATIAPEAERSLVVRIQGHTFLGDVTVRTVNPSGPAKR